jgi:hypothetical protein
MNNKGKLYTDGHVYEANEIMLHDVHHVYIIYPPEIDYAIQSFGYLKDVFLQEDLIGIDRPVF